jgi:hypothetical protein
MTIRIILLMVLLVLANVAQANLSELINTYYRDFEAASPPASRQQLESLLLDVESHVNANRNNADAWLAVGIIRAGYAKSIGGMKGLDELDNARQELEHSIRIDRTAMASAAPGMLGRLYATVPRWPLAFGSKRKARALLTEAMTENPSAALPGFYYALLLVEDGDADAARDILKSLAGLEMPCACEDWNNFILNEASRHLQ